MIVQTALAKLLENQAMEYVDKVAASLNRRPDEISKLNKAKREKIASILTGLYVLSNPNFRKSLQVSDDDFTKIKNQLHSNGLAAHHTITAGKRMPSMLATMQKHIDGFGKLKPEDKQKFIGILEKIHTALKGI